MQCTVHACATKAYFLTGCLRMVATATVLRPLPLNRLPAVFVWMISNSLLVVAAFLLFSGSAISGGLKRATVALPSYTYLPGMNQQHLTFTDD